MRKGGGKAKGASFEREVCKRLSLWVSHGKQEDVFWRSAMSGGRSTVASARGQRLAAQAGDVSAIQPVGHLLTNRFLVELKFYSDLNFDGLLTGTGKLLKFWHETCAESLFYKRIPLLIAKENRSPIFATTNKLGLHFLNATDSVIIGRPESDFNVLSFQELMQRQFTETRLVSYDYGMALAAFKAHKTTAVSRGLGFDFEFEEWVVWWEENLGPSWQQKRGHHKGQYVMARIGDIGPYAHWNTKCIRHEENARERGTNGVAARGTDVSTNKLSEENVIDIFNSTEAVKSLARSHNVSVDTIYMIKRRTIWKHLLPKKRIRAILDS